MGESRERDGFFGKYTEHFDDDGNKIGESREREGFFGKYTEDTDAQSNKIGESREREGFFGNYTEHTDSSGNKTGESREQDGFFGKYTEHTDDAGNKVGESRERDGFFGRYTEHTGSGWTGESRRQETKPYSSSSDDNGCAVIIGWLIGIIVVVVIAIWLALNIVLPIALLNSALALTILALCYKERKTLFASLALIGGCYMLLDIFKGWFSANFVNNVVGTPVWITCFVYFNAAAIGLSVWFLVQPIWANAKKIESSDKKKSLLLMGVSILLVVIATITIPIVYHSIQNPFAAKTKDSVVSNSEIPYDIPAIKAHITSFRLYESGVVDLPQKERKYGTIFTQSQTRCINWEVQFEYPSTQNRVDFTLKAIWYRADGSIVTEQTFQTYTNKGWNGSFHSFRYGTNKLGETWQKGLYRVELYADGKKIVERPFEVRVLGDKRNSGDKTDTSNETDTDEIFALNSSNLIGTWEGTFGNNNSPSNIKIDKIEGDTFYGILNSQSASIAFTGSMNANTREIIFKETKVISPGNTKDWKLGTNKGVFSNNGKTIKGKGEDGRSSYSWKFSK